MKYLKKFANHSEYESYITGSSVAYPNVSVCENEYELHMTDVGEIIDPDAPIDWSKEPLTFEITSNGNIVWKVWAPWPGASIPSTSIATIQYSKNGGEWANITSSTGGTSISVVVGDMVQFRGDNMTYTDTMNISNGFSGTTCGFNVKGNIMSLINSTGFSTATTLESSYTFNNLFNSCTGLTDASNLILPATTLAYQCYSQMFYGCTSLTSTPELPATTLVNYCYNGMFILCSSLTTAPELPATTLASNCYEYMFAGCTNLNYIKCLATDISASYCTNYWVDGVQTTTGTFVKNSSMSSWTTGNNGIPSNWTVQDAS